MDGLLAVFRAADKTDEGDDTVTMDEFIDFNIKAFSSMSDEDFAAQAEHWHELAEKAEVIDDELGDGVTAADYVSQAAAGQYGEFY
jgi:hypothetical protein